MIFSTEVNCKSIEFVGSIGIIIDKDGHKLVCYSVMQMEVVNTKEINIATMLIRKRKEKGVTQEQLADYIGVSKASVSKWETGQSYPDITFLPKLATYFNISIDDLMGYSPQMAKEDIRKVYHKLSLDFATKAFDDVLVECFGVIKKYYSCFPLLYRMSVLLINHYNLSKNEQQKIEILQKSIELCVRVRNESGDVWLSKESTLIEALCYLTLGQPQPVLDLLGETIRPITDESVFIAQAYQMMGNLQKAKEVMQISMYQHLIVLLSTTPSYILLNGEQADEIIKRTLEISEVFDLESLQPNIILQVYYVAAQLKCTRGNKEEALKMLEKYADICISRLFPLSLHGDDYFNLIDKWLTDSELGYIIPRNEKTIKESIWQSITENPAFACLTEETKYKNIINRLKEYR